MRAPILVLSIILLVHHGQTIKFTGGPYEHKNTIHRTLLEEDMGEPLLVTPYIEKGQIKEAREAALVKGPQFLNVTSYSGYFTTDARFNSNMFFWFFPSTENVAEVPVILWLNGGPGSSSLLGLFDELGPFQVEKNLTLSLREYSWHKNNSVLFLDNPVGAGFSFTNGGFALNETKVGEDLHNSLTQFFQLFPELQKNPFFLTGESYAGKYLPAIGYTIMKKNPDAKLKINLKGIMIGDAWTEPVRQLNYGAFAYNIGFVNAAVAKQLDDFRDKAIAEVKAGNLPAAQNDSQNILDTIYSVSGGVDFYNYVNRYPVSIYPKFLNQAEIRNALHVGSTEFGDKGAGDALDALDEMKGVASWVEELLEEYRVLYYTGQFDIMCGYPMVVDLLNSLNFTGAEKFRNSTRDVWYAGNDTEPAAYITGEGNLVSMMVRNAGHLVPQDQPYWAYNILYEFTRNLI